MALSVARGTSIVQRAVFFGSVLDVAGLFAPSVVDACTGRTAHDLTLGGKKFIAAEVKVQEDGTLRELYGDRAKLIETRQATDEEEAQYLRGDEPKNAYCPTARGAGLTEDKPSN